MLYVIACTTRTGSTLLCDLLAQTGRHGSPHEFWEELLFEEQLRPAGGFGSLAEELADQARYLAKLRARLASPNGAFGVKVQARQLGQFRPVLDTAQGAAMRHGPWVRLSRQDKLAQAISGVKALQTGGWHSGLPARGQPHFDRAAIAAQLDKIATWEAQWDAFFAGAGIAPLALTYEQLVADLPGTLVRVGRHLGLPIGADEAARLEPRLVRQADAVNAAWRKAWLAGEG